MGRNRSQSIVWTFEFYVNCSLLVEFDLLFSRSERWLEKRLNILTVSMTVCNLHNWVPAYMLYEYPEEKKALSRTRYQTISVQSSSVVDGNANGDIVVLSGHDKDISLHQFLIGLWLIQLSWNERMIKIMRENKR